MLVLAAPQVREVPQGALHLLDYTRPMLDKSHLAKLDRKAYIAQAQRVRVLARKLWLAESAAPVFALSDG